MVLYRGSDVNFSNPLVFSNFSMRICVGYPINKHVIFLKALNNSGKS